MAVKARDSITLFHQTDIYSVTWYYLLQSSTATPPTKPTTDPPPSGWTTSEPTYTEGSTNSLYIVEKTVFSDGTFAYSNVSLSTSYEAAKAAYNKAVQSAQTATRYITDITDGIMVHPEGDDTSAPTGWKITDVIEMLKSGVSYFWAGLVNSVATLRLGPSNSRHVMIDDDSVSIMNGDDELASFSQNGLTVEIPDGHLTAASGVVISQNGSEKGRIWGSSSYGDWMVMEGEKTAVLYGIQYASIYAPKVGIAHYAPASIDIDPEDCDVEISGTLTVSGAVTAQTISADNHKVGCSEKGTDGYWTWYKYSDGSFDIYRRTSATISSYYDLSFLHGYYADYYFPAGCKPVNANYGVFTSWKIGSGFGWDGGVGNKSTSSFRAYAMGSASGSQACVIDVYVHGNWK